MYLKHVVTAGIVAVALAAAPASVGAQSSGSGSPTSSQAAGSQATSQSTTTSQSQGSDTQPSGGNQQEIRQHLGNARQALAELTKLPAAAQLQGEQRTQVANLISNFNAFATATTDWRSKYDVVDESLDQLLDAAGAADATASTGATGTPPSTTAPSSTSPDTPAAPGAASTGGSTTLDPTIVAKLREVRQHLDLFEVASGDPTFVVEKIEKILDQAAGGASGSASGAVGTTGATAVASASGSVTLDASQLAEIRKHLDSIRQAAKR